MTRLTPHLTPRRVGPSTNGTADEPERESHPLRRRRHQYLCAQHRHGIAKRRDAVPSQLEIIVEASPYDMNMAVDQAWNSAPATRVDHRRTGGCRMNFGFGANRKKPAIPNFFYR